MNSERWHYTLTSLSVFGLGIVRTYYLVQVDSSSIDKSWHGFNVFVTGMAEFHIGMMCACAPSTQHFFKRYGRPLTSRLRSVTGFSTTGRSAAGRRPKDGAGLSDTGVSSVAMEIMSEKEGDVGEARRFQSPVPHAAQGLSPASSKSPLTSA